ncbi:transmembrane protease serine 2 [Astyanax mexicanus]|uniref:Transmembrane protease serine 2 n=1 Tax=Astyanax mexicanus TaxID=7994 RepID=A0A8T2KV07_ASTMX|nr:transmembrane protease serine 2 [Astyanax mexicanus]
MYSNTSHDNYGFQHEDERPPPYHPPPYAPNYSQGLYPTLPQYPTTPHVPINTHHTVTAGQPHPTATRKVAGRNQWFCIVPAIITILVVVGVAAVLVWYFAFQMCGTGQRCGENGLRDCSGGECFRLYGSNFQLLSFSAKDKTWKPVCSSRWDDNIGRRACQQMGYSRTDYVSSGEMKPGSGSSGGYMVLNTDYISGISSAESAHSYLTDSSTCQSNAVVTLKCVECGKSTVQTRIVGGEVVTSRTRWPWQVSLQSGGGHLCGGSIISSSWIVSAAHCFQSRPDPSQWTVFAGFLTRNEMRSSPGNSVSHIISHAGYDSRTNDNDIALMKLSTPLRLSSSVGPVCLPSAGLDFSAPRECYITGFGALFSQGPASNELREAKVTLINRSICNSRVVYNGQITDTMICAGKLEGGVDACQGDSGGPLVTQENSLWYLVGDTSWGQGCAVRNKPGVYGNVTFFLGWISEQMQV